MDNWSGTENQIMKGYILYALKEIEINDAKNKLTEKQKEALFCGLKWATDDMTAEEAYKYYMNH